MLLKKIILFIHLVISSHLLFGQSSIVRGLVRDSISTLPIQDAIIIIKQADKILASTHSNANGNFLFALNFNSDQPIRIECRHISYKAAYQQIPARLSVIDCNFFLSQANQELKPVEITSHWQVKQHEDTLKYNPEAYKTATTKSVADLLSNIPGFKVLPDGQILFQNRSVSALLIDGDNIADEQYGAINKNLDARAVGGIEVFNDYEKNAVLASVRKSGKLAVNLQINEAFKGKISGNITAGVGVPDRAVLNPSLARISQKNKHFIFGNANNISLNPKGDVFKVSSTSSVMYSLEDEQTKLLTDPYLDNNDLPASFTVNNQTAFSSTLGLVKLKQKREITYRIGYEYDRLRNKEIGETTYYIDSSQNWLKRDSCGLEKRSNQISLRMQYRHNKSSKFAGEATSLVLFYSPTFQLGSAIGGIITDTTLQKSNQTRVYVQIGYNGAIKTKALGILQIKSFSSYQKNNADDLTRTNRFNNIFQYNFPDASILQQDFAVEKKMLYFSLSNLPKSGKKQIEYGVDILHKHHQYNQTLRFIPIHDANSSFMHFSPSNQNQFYGGYINIKLYGIKDHKIDIKGISGIEFMQISDQNQAIPHYNLQVRHEWKLGKFFIIQSDANLKQTMPDMNWFGPDTVLQSIQNLVQSAKTISPINILTIHSGFTYRKLTGINYSLRYTYNRIVGDYGWMPFIEPGYNLLQAAPIGLSQQHAVDADVRKFIYQIKSTISLSGRYSHSTSDLMVNLMPVTNYIQRFQWEVKWATSFSGKFNFEAAANTSNIKITQYSTEDKIRSNIRQYDIIFKSIYQPNSKTHVGMDVKALVFENARSWAGQLFAERKLSKNTSIQVQWHNTFFTKELKFQFNTPNSRGYSSFQLVPSYLLCKVTWYL